MLQGGVIKTILDFPWDLYIISVSKAYRSSCNCMSKNENIFMYVFMIF